MKVPPELDDLMWKLAETDDPQALEEFGDRYPDFRQEMAQRLRMVRNLKGAKPSAKVDRFVPKAEVVPYAEPTPKWMVPAAIFMGVVSIAFATYAVTTFAQSQARQEPPVAQNSQQQPPTTPSDDDYLKKDRSTLDPNDPGQVPAQPTNPNPGVASQVPPAFKIRVTVRGTDVSLMQMLQSVAAQAGIQLEIPPGFVDQRINCDYQNSEALAVMQDMGRNFGFSAFVQGDRTVLLIPARSPDPDTSERPSSGSSSPASGGDNVLPPVN
ncbi:MAG: hypothetical protein MUC92_02030 [Fimbriimonadaceae bacterium]|nr:hypothetical protein [Fimbriimonadaceae bacterium]